MNSIKITNRLKTIANHIKKNAAVTDVGTDHGLLPIYLAQKGQTKSITATDKSPESLKTAQRNAEKNAITNKIKFAVATGLNGADETKTDTIVTAGMGGETIIEILKEAPWTKKPGVTLIMQPQTKTNELCQWLRENGYTIKDAELTQEKGKLYTIIIATGGKTNSTHEPEMEILTILKENQNPLLKNYLNEKITKTRQTIKNMEKSKTPNKTKIKQKQKELEELIGLNST